MRKTAIGLISSAVALCMSACTPASAAAIGQGVQSAPTRMMLNGGDWSNPAHLIRREAPNSEPTSWLPIWYLFDVMSKLNIQSTWDGQHWNLQLPSGMHAELTNLPMGSSRANEVSIQIGGTTVEYAPRFAHRDLSGNVMTSYIPIWYLMQALQRVGIASTWDGTTWSMTTSESSPSVTKMTVVKDFANALHIQPDAAGTNPFDDVRVSDWPYVNAVLQKGYFTSDSANHFGTKDSVDVQTLDHAYQLYVGIPDRDLSWNAGGGTVAWADAVHLNQGVTMGTLTTTSEVQLMANLMALYRGYSEDANGTYHLWFQPYDSKGAFAHNPDVNAGIASKGQGNAFRLADEITFKVNGSGKLIFALPWMSDQNQMEVTCGSLYNPSGNHTQYSLNQGGTWSIANGFDGYDSRDPLNGGSTTPIKEVIIRTQGHAELGVSQIFGTHDITFVQLDFSPSAGTVTPQIQDSTGQPAWEG